MNTRKKIAVGLIAVSVISATAYYFYNKKKKISDVKEQGSAGNADTPNDNTQNNEIAQSGNNETTPIIISNNENLVVTNTGSPDTWKEGDVVVTNNGIVAIVS